MNQYPQITNRIDPRDFYRDVSQWHGRSKHRIVATVSQNGSKPRTVTTNYRLRSDMAFGRFRRLRLVNALKLLCLTGHMAPIGSSKAIGPLQDDRGTCSTGCEPAWEVVVEVSQVMFDFVYLCSDCWLQQSSDWVVLHHTVVSGVRPLSHTRI